MRQTQVLVASEYAPVRRMLTDIVAAEEGFKVVGEAGSDVQATAMAKQIKPDVVLLDFRLPYSMGYDEVRLSRVSGLDAAMAIKQQVPGARVVLLANLDSAGYRDSNNRADKCLAIDKDGIRAVFTLRDLCCGTVTHDGPIFANVEFRDRVAVASAGGSSTYSDVFGGRAGRGGSGVSRATPGETLMVIGAALITFSVLFFALVTFSPLMGSNPYVGIFAWMSSPLIFIAGIVSIGVGFFVNRKEHKRRGFIKA